MEIFSEVILTFLAYIAVPVLIIGLQIYVIVFIIKTIYRLIFHSPGLVEAVKDDMKKQDSVTRKESMKGLSMLLRHFGLWS